MKGLVTKTSVLIWSGALGLVFVIGFVALQMMGTKAAKTFSSVPQKQTIPAQKAAGDEAAPMPVSP